MCGCVCVSKCPCKNSKTYFVVPREKKTASCGDCVDQLLSVGPSGLKKVMTLRPLLLCASLSHPQRHTHTHTCQWAFSTFLSESQFFIHSHTHRMRHRNRQRDGDVILIYFVTFVDIFFTFKSQKYIYTYIYILKTQAHRSS